MGPGMMGHGMMQGMTGQVGMMPGMAGQGDTAGEGKTEPAHGH